MIDPEIQTALISAAGAVAVAVVGVVGLRWQGRHLKEVRHQVANSHETNLRDDLDGMRDDIRLVLEGQKQFAKDLGHEREERLELARQFYQHRAESE